MGKWFLLGALGLCACSSSSGNTDAAGGQASAGSGGASGSSASAGETSAGGEANGGGSSPGGSASAGSSAAGGSVAGSGSFVRTPVNDSAKMRGQIYLDQTTTDHVTFSGSVDATFDTERAQWDGCTKNQLGPCWYYDCPAGSNPLGNTMAGATTPESAGTITFSGLPGGAPVVVSDLDYRSTVASQLWPLAGGQLTLTLAGSAAVPAFTMQVPAPPHVFLTTINGQPTIDSLSRSDGVRLVWSAAGAGTVFFSVFQFSGTRPAAICEFDAGAGAGDLPAIVLQQLDPGAKYFYALRGDARGFATDGSWQIETYAYAYESLVPERSIVLE